jgi:hypothetical protein
MKEAEKLPDAEKTAVTYEPMLANVIDSKGQAVSIYVKEIGLAIQVLLNQREHPTYYFNSNDGQIKRLEVINLLHKCAMDALGTL